jgi:hypothetical protein
MKMKRSHLNSVCLLIIATSYMGNTEEVACDPNTGPNGARHCIKLSQHNDYQLATCRKNFYIQEHIRHNCGEKFDNTYCYLECMLELYRKENGKVSSRDTPNVY